MARPPTRRSPRQKPPPTGEDEPAALFPTEGNDTYTPALIISRTPTPAPPAAPALALAAINSTVRYSEADLQRIFKTILETRPPAPAPQSLVFLDGSCKRPLKARFPELYCGKTYMECYNFIQQCEDHFATTRAKGPNRVPFAANFFQQQVMFCWQQHKAKNAGETNVLLSWEEFKVFFCQSLGESRIFVDSI